MAFGIKRIGPIVPTPTGAIDIRYDDGIPDVAPPDIVIAAIPTLSGTEGQAISFPLSGYVSGADAAGATYAIENIVGTLAAIGASLSTSTITGTGIVGAWTGRIIVTSGATDFPGPVFTINIIAAVVTDNVAPTTPLAPSVAVVGTTATVTGLWPADVRTSTVGPSDPVKVRLERSVNGGAYSTLTTLTAEGPQPSPVAVSATIGTATSPSSSHDGKDLSVTVQDGLVSDAAENGRFAGWQVSGAFDLVMTIPAYVSLYEWTTCGPQIRASLDPRAISVSIARRPDAAGKGTAALYRLEQDGAVGWSGDANLSGDVTVRISRSYPGNVISFHWFDASTSSWVQWASQVVNLPQLVYAGFCGARNQIGAAVTMTATNCWLNAYGSYSYVDTVAEGSTYDWRAVALDSAGTPNSSSVSAVTRRNIGSQTVARKKFNPGHYCLLDGQLRKDNRSSLMATHQSHIAQLANEPTVRGVKVFMQWSSLEGAVAGDYTAGLAMISQYLDWCAAVGKQLMISVNHAQFGGYGADRTIFFPTYIVNGPQYGLTVMTNGITIRHWQEATATRLMALNRAIATLEGHPNFELVTNGETSVAVTAGTDGFSNTALTTQLLRIIADAGEAFPTTGFRVSTNYLSPNSLMDQVLQALADNGCVAGGPDVIPKELIQANSRFVALGLKGVGVWASEIQSPSLGGHEGLNADDWTALELYRHAVFGGGDSQSGATGSGVSSPAMGPHYCVWIRQSNGGLPQHQWSTGILPFIRSINGMVGNGATPGMFLPSAVDRPTSYQ